MQCTKGCGLPDVEHELYNKHVPRAVTPHEIELTFIFICEIDMTVSVYDCPKKTAIAAYLS